MVAYTKKKYQYGGKGKYGKIGYGNIAREYAGRYIKQPIETGLKYGVGAPIALAGTAAATGAFTVPKAAIAGTAAVVSSIPQSILGVAKLPGQVLTTLPYRAIQTQRAKSAMKSALGHDYNRTIREVQASVNKITKLKAAQKQNQNTMLDQLHAGKKKPHDSRYKEAQIEAEIKKLQKTITRKISKYDLEPIQSTSNINRLSSTFLNQVKSQLQKKSATFNSQQQQKLQKNSKYIKYNAVKQKASSELEQVIGGIALNEKAIIDAKEKIKQADNKHNKMKSDQNLTIQQKEEIAVAQYKVKKNAEKEIKLATKNLANLMKKQTKYGQLKTRADQAITALGQRKEYRTATQLREKLERERQRLSKTYRNIGQSAYQASFLRPVVQGVKAAAYSAAWDAKQAGKVFGIKPLRDIKETKTLETIFKPKTTRELISIVKSAIPSRLKTLRTAIDAIRKSPKYRDSSEQIIALTRFSEVLVQSENERNNISQEIQKLRSDKKPVSQDLINRRATLIDEIDLINSYITDVKNNAEIIQKRNAKIQPEIINPKLDILNGINFTINSTNYNSSYIFDDSGKIKTNLSENVYEGFKEELKNKYKAAANLKNYVEMSNIRAIYDYFGYLRQNAFRNQLIEQSTTMQKAISTIKTNMPALYEYTRLSSPEAITPS